MAELNNTIVRGNLRVTSQAEIQEVIENGTSLANKYLALSGGTLTGTVTTQGIVPDVDNTRLIGSSSKEYAQLYTRTAGMRHLDADAVYTGDHTLYIGYGSIAKTNLIYFYTSDASNRYPICYMDSNGLTMYKSILAQDTNTYNLGASNKQFNNIYGKTIYENGTALSSKYLPLSGGTMTGTISSHDIVPDSGYRYNLGTASRCFQSVCTHTIATGSTYSNIAFIDATDGHSRSSPIGVIGTENKGDGEAPITVDYYTIGGGQSYIYNNPEIPGHTELRMSCLAETEGYDSTDYIVIRTNGAEAGSVLYLPALQYGDEETIATTSDIPSVLPAAYVTTPPSSNNNVGIKFVLLNSQTYPESSVTKRNGYIYMWY